MEAVTTARQYTRVIVIFYVVNAYDAYGIVVFLLLGMFLLLFVRRLEHVHEAIVGEIVAREGALHLLKLFV